MRAVEVMAPRIECLGQITGTPDKPIRHLPCDPEWTELNSLGFTSGGSKEAVPHLDDLFFTSR